MHDLAIITVSTNELHWIRPCLPTVFEHMGDISCDFVVVDNDSHDGIAEERDGQVVHLRLVRRPQRLDRRGRPELGEPREVGRVDHLQVSEDPTVTTLRAASPEGSADTDPSPEGRSSALG